MGRLKSCCLGALAVAFAGFLAACAEEDKAGEGPGAPTTATTTPAQAVATPTPGDTAPPPAAAADAASTPAAAAAAGPASKKPAPAQATPTAASATEEEPREPENDVLVGQMFSDEDSERDTSDSVPVREDDLAAQLGRVGGDNNAVRRPADGRVVDDVKAPPVGMPLVKIDTPTTSPSSSLTPAMIGKKIRSMYSHALKQCYKRVLKADAKAAGTLKLKFTIGETGRVTTANISGADSYADADGCVLAKVKAWRFAVPKDGDGNPVLLTVQVSLRMYSSAH